MEKEDIIISASDRVQKINKEDNINFYEEELPLYLFNGKTLTIQTTDNNKSLSDLENEMITDIINNFVGEQYENTIILTGAGASILNDYSSGDLTGYSGKTVWQLTEEIEKYLTDRIEMDFMLSDEDNDSDKIMSLEEFSKTINYFKENEDYSVDNVNIEDLLSYAESAKDYVKFDDKIKEKRFLNTLREIEMKIKELCELQLHYLHPHNQFLEKVTMRRKSHNRVKVFTTNYDTLFEQAAQEEGYIVIDGFSFDHPRTFNPFMFDYDFVRRENNKIIDEPDYIEKVIHLYKLHGSIDWEKWDGNRIVKKNNPFNPLMIYPRKNKFEQSYEDPYFEMFSRFQVELRKRNTLLIAIGFSFADKHIQTIVENAVKNNPSLKILIVDFNISQDTFEFFIERAKKYNNIMLYQGVFGDFVERYKKQKAYSDALFSAFGDINE